MICLCKLTEFKQYYLSTYVIAHIDKNNVVYLRGGTKLDMLYSTKSIYNPSESSWTLKFFMNHYQILCSISSDNIDEWIDKDNNENLIFKYWPEEFL